MLLESLLIPDGPSFPKQFLNHSEGHSLLLARTQSLLSSLSKYSMSLPKAHSALKVFDSDLGFHIYPSVHTFIQEKGCVGRAYWVPNVVLGQLSSTCGL